MGTPIDVREREALCELLGELGPEATTLCQGWTTSDLAAHLVLREHLHRWTDVQIAKVKAPGFDHVLRRLRSGPPPIPWRLPFVRTYANGLEYFIHHEDVRRANGQGPRAEDPELERLCWRTTSFLARRLARAIRPFGVELATGYARRHLGAAESALVSGPATELVLYLAGRRSAAKVELTGSLRAIEAVRCAETRL